jgi:hypothetical protein
MPRAASIETHIYRGIQPPERSVHTIDGSTYITEISRDIVTGKEASFRERVFAPEGNYLRFVVAKDDCSGELLVEKLPGMDQWYVTAFLGVVDIFSLAYDLKGNLTRVLLNKNSPSLYEAFGHLDTTGAFDEYFDQEHAQKPLPLARVLLVRSTDDEGEIGFSPIFYEGMSSSTPITSDMWSGTWSIRIENSGTLFSLDWFRHNEVSAQVILPNGVIKKGHFPKKIRSNRITVDAKHIDQANFPLEGLFWLLQWGDYVAGRDGFEA